MVGWKAADFDAGHHVMFSMYNDWEQGDLRGHHERDHRKHCSGDYKNPPPAEEFASYRAASQRDSGEPCVLRPAERATVGALLLEYMHRKRWSPVALAVTRSQVHMRIDWALDRKTAKLRIGDARKSVSKRFKPTVGKKLWGVNNNPKKLNDSRHAETVAVYIAKHIRENAWVWVCDTEILEEAKRQLNRNK